MVRFSVTYALMIKGIGFGALMVSALKIAVWNVIRSAKKWIQVRLYHGTDNGLLKLRAAAWYGNPI